MAKRLMVNFLDEEFYKKVESHARINRQSLSAFVLNCIEYYFNNENDKSQDRLDSFDLRVDQVAQEVSELKNELLLIKSSLQQALAQLSSMVPSSPDNPKLDIKTGDR